MLKVTDLYAQFTGFGGTRVVRAIDGINFSLEQGETMGLVGESGCGKTTTCHAIFRLLPPAGEIV
ncbi:MAG: ATP-binding cassette domain-containing protein, partial [Chloroflexota bacterium]|nr:ATP-binding cassette domain-containing protein [Chloroflexota bacterium]